jgi:UDP-N-acetylmuramate: L-alanyl-gamma-D-glutamyl-meso-diaminopimelate ligase
MYPDRRVVVAFEPRSATQRRNVFQDGFAKALALADRVYIGECPLDKRISEENRMNTASMQAAIGTKAKAFPTNAALLEALSSELAPGDSVIFMSSGSFSGAQYKLAEALKAR